MGEAAWQGEPMTMNLNKRSYCSAMAGRAWMQDEERDGGRKDGVAERVGEARHAGRRGQVNRGFAESQHQLITQAALYPQ